MNDHSGYNRLLALVFVTFTTANAIAAAGEEGANFTGHVAVGYRDVDTSGDKTKYQQHINLENGARLFDLGLLYEERPAEQRSALMPERIEVNAYGLGGEPFRSVGIDARRYGVYRLRYQHSSSDYFYEDLLLRPEDVSAVNVTGGDYHHFDFERERDTLDFEIDLSERATFDLGFSRHRKQGDSTTVLDIEREEFELDKPIDEELSSWDLGFRYAWDKVTLTLTERWHDYDNDSAAFLPEFSPGSSAGAPTQLDYYFLDQPYGFKSREHGVGLRVRPTQRWDLQFNALAGDLDLDLSARERGQGRGFTGAPLMRDFTGAGSIDRDTRLYDFEATFALNDQIQLSASMRRNELDQQGDLAFGAITGSSEWRIETTGYELGVDFAVTNTLTVGGGWSGEQRVTDYRQQQTGRSALDRVETDRNGFFAHLAYQPNRNAEVTFSVEDNSIDDPFTLASATDSLRYRVRAQLRWDNGFSFSASHHRTDYENNNTDWQSVTTQTDLRVSWTAGPVTLSGGAGFVDLKRNIDQLVVGGFRRDLFLLEYEADADFLDGNIRWRASERIDLSVSYRDYSNDGSFPVDRSDFRAVIAVDLTQHYGLQIRYRNADFTEDQLESFETDLWEIALDIRW